MAIEFETFGNAIVTVYEDGAPVLATDPWLKGTCYFGSWAHEVALSERQLADVINAEAIWISHGHPDHLHPESLSLLPKGKKIYLPDHYSSEIADFLREDGFDVTVMKYRQWFKLSDNVRICCMDNINQDAILVVETRDGLLINKNDSPFFGEESFLKGLIKKFPKDKTYTTALCAIDADMKNFVDADGQRLLQKPDELKPGAIWSVARELSKIGVGHFCCSSSQHKYVRTDSLWANDYRVGWEDVSKYWSRPDVDIIKPYSRVNMTSGEVISRDVAGNTSIIDPEELVQEDDWTEKLTPEEWKTVEDFFMQFETLIPVCDFVALTVGDEKKTIWIGGAEIVGRAKGVHFMVPRKSLLECLEYGYFDDLLIGNFMKTELINMGLYPEFTPRLAKYGGNAKVYAANQLSNFKRHYRQRNPVAYFKWQVDSFFKQKVVGYARVFAERLGVKSPIKAVYRRMMGDPT